MKTQGNIESINNPWDIDTINSKLARLATIGADIDNILDDTEYGQV